MMLLNIATIRQPYPADSLYTFSRHSGTFLEVVFILHYILIASSGTSIYIVLRHSVEYSKMFHGVTVKRSP